MKESELSLITLVVSASRYLGGGAGGIRRSRLPSGTGKDMVV